MIEYAITVRPPWSWAIAEAQVLTSVGVAPKLVENRGKPIPPKHYNTRVAIHAGLDWSNEGAADPRVQQAWTAFRQAYHLTAPNPLLAAHGDTRSGLVGALGPNNMWIDMGAVLAVATIAGCHRADIPNQDGEPCCPPWGDLYYRGGYAWHIELADVVRLREPVPVRGQLAVPWHLPEDVAAAVTAGYGKAVQR